MCFLKFFINSCIKIFKSNYCTPCRELGVRFSLLSFRVRVSSCGRGRFRVLARLRGKSCFALVFIFSSLAAAAAVDSASVCSLVFATIMSENQETEDDQTLDIQASRLTCNNPSVFIDVRDPDTNSPCAPNADNHTAAYYAKMQHPSGRMAGKPGDPSDLHGRGGYFIAVHVGAGYHAPQNSKAYRRVMRRACWAAAEILSQVWSPPHPPFLIEFFSPHCLLFASIRRRRRRRNFFTFQEICHVQEFGKIVFMKIVFV